jgi:hypothetical protein
MTIRTLALALALGILGCGSGQEPSQQASDVTPVGTKAFGDTCATDADCVTGMCRNFDQRTVLKCTQPCTPATAATDCPAPPSTGECAGHGYCKLN